MTDPLSLLRRRQDGLSRFGDVALHGACLDDILDRACQLVAEAMDADVAAIYRLDGEGEDLQWGAGVGWQAGTVGQLPIRADQTSPSGLALRTREPVVIVDFTREGRFERPTLLAAHDIQATIDVVIPEGSPDSAFGVLQIGQTSPRAFDCHDVDYLKIWAHLVAGAVGRLRTLAAPLRSDAFARGILEASPDGVRVVGADGRVEFLNEQGRHLHELGPDDDPVGLDYAGLWLAADAARIREALATARAGKKVRLDVSGPTAQGTLKRWELSMAPMLEQTDREPRGPIQRVVVVSRDMTARWLVEQARRDSEERLRATFQTAPVGIVVAQAPSGRIVDANARAEQVFGRRVLPGPDGDGDREWVSFHADGSKVEASEYPIARALAGEPRPALEVQFELDDGTRRWISLDAAPLRREDGTIDGAIMTALDIDLQRRAASVLLEANASLYATVQDRNRDLAAANRSLVAEMGGRAAAEGLVRQLQKMEAVGQLTGGLAHDFNNMLAVIMSGLTLVQRRLDRGETDVGRFIDAAMAATNKAATLSQRLLAFSRQQALSPEPMDVNQLIGGMSDLLHRTLGEAIRIETVLAAELWTTHADSNQLENAVLNLAVNARDAMPGGGRLLIETANIRQDGAASEQGDPIPAGDYVTLTVTDTGTGMAPDVIGRVFDPFFTTKTVGKGTGLGLSQVYGFVKQSGGHVRLTSELGEGTVVRIALPRFFGPLLEASQPMSATIGPARGETILVVEDDRQVRELTVAGLRELGFATIDADGAASALRALDDNPAIALLFTDVVMPDLNGRRLADEAQRRRPGLKVLFTSGYMSDVASQDGPRTRPWRCCPSRSAWTNWPARSAQPSTASGRRQPRRQRRWL